MRGVGAQYHEREWEHPQCERRCSWALFWRMQALVWGPAALELFVTMTCMCSEVLGTPCASAGIGQALEQQAVPKPCYLSLGLPAPATPYETLQGSPSPSPSRALPMWSLLARRACGAHASSAGESCTASASWWHTHNHPALAAGVAALGGPGAAAAAAEVGHACFL